jgi:NCAIR mutase (PurE)-related protein
VVFGQGKTTEQIVAIVEKMAASSDKVLVTRADAEAYNAVASIASDAVYNETARTIVVDRSKNKELSEGVMVLSAGTADLPVAEEAAVTAEIMGNEVDRAYDVGVAGIHRLFDHLPRLRNARVIVVVAGMEGALPGVVSGLVSVPVVAVPTSCGYGTSFGGIAPLLTMLNSCSPGVSVVNIDNGFGAGYLASLINRDNSKK